MCIHYVCLMWAVLGGNFIIIIIIKDDYRPIFSESNIHESQTIKWTLAKVYHSRVILEVYGLHTMDNALDLCH